MKAASFLVAALLGLGLAALRISGLGLATEATERTEKGLEIARHEKLRLSSGGIQETAPFTPFSVFSPGARPHAFGAPASVANSCSEAPTVGLGVGASLGGKRVFPADNPWNQDISGEPVDPNSDRLIAGIGADLSLHPDFGTRWQGAPNGIPYVVVTGTQPRLPVRFRYADESDPGPYPIPPDAPIEGGPAARGDRHVLVIDRDHWQLYELFSAYPDGNGWRAGSGAIFDLNSNAVRPAGWTSADAAGLPVFPGLVRYDEVMEQKAIRHALRFTVVHSRRGYVAPARHFASSDPNPNLPPMGMRVRLKASYDLSGFPEPARILLTALKRYGMMVADNGGNWFISGAPDDRWDDDALNTLKRVKGSDFEVVRMGTVVTR